MTAPNISDAVFTSYHAPADSGGLLGFVAVTFADALRIDGIAVRRALDGDVVLSFPSRRDRHGRQHPIVHPIDAAARAAITAAVLSALDADLAGPGTATSAPTAQPDSAR